MFIRNIDARTTRVVLAAGSALCISLAFAPAASAERIWDFGEYERCMETMTVPDVRTCCVRSGGDLTQGHNPKCVAPIADERDESGPGQHGPIKPRPSKPATAGNSLG